MRVPISRRRTLLAAYSQEHRCLLIAQSLGGLERNALLTEFPIWKGPPIMSRQDNDSDLARGDRPSPTAFIFASRQKTP
jgi:hypothetical protein